MNTPVNTDRVEPQTFTVEPSGDGQTLAAVMRPKLPGHSWKQVRSLCARGHVTTDGVVTTDPAARVQQGQAIEISPKVKKATVRTVELLHVDHDVVVVDKPAGLMSVPFAGERDTLVHLAAGAVRRKTGKPAPPLRVVQRLDIDTTGVLVFARNKKAERHLQQQFRKHSVDRRYRALVLGKMDDITIDTSIVRNRGDGLRGRARRGVRTDGAKSATTHIRVLDVYDVPPSMVVEGDALQLSYVECSLETGRQHQIRIHLSEAGHPLVGERVYIREYQGPKVRGFTEGQGRPLLHAARLGFVHPSDEVDRAFVRPLPEDFETLLDQLSRAKGAGPESPATEMDS